MHTIEADYLVVGAGAMGMAFIDTLVSETQARVVLVDRNHQPGGHWTTAYPFRAAASALGVLRHFRWRRLRTGV
jgi:cation diffusion facilitator CzcD-associated flavoprotein CzcO